MNNHPLPVTRMSKQVLVTTGATVTFKKLFEYVINQDFLNLLVDLNYKKLVIQYGSSTESKELILNLLNRIDITDMKANDGIRINGTNGNIECSFNGVLQITCFPFDVDLVDKFTAKSDLVISHAGTGSIIDTLRADTNRNTGLILIINEDLKDNHQLEIAESFEKLNVLRFLKKTEGQGEFSRIVRDLDSDVGDLVLDRLSEPNGEIVERIICDMIF